MHYVDFGKTGLKVSVAGLGCGGHSRLGMARGESEDYAADMVRRALDLGINVVDTAERYGTEGAVGKGIAGRPRESVVVCTKAGLRRAGELVSAAELRESVEGSLRRLRSDWIDVLYLHGLHLEEYDYALAEWRPEMERLRNEGKIRLLGISEGFGKDTGHRMLARAVQDEGWNVFMVGFNLLNPSARYRVFPGTMEKGVGTTIMNAVRRTLSQPEHLQETIRKLIDEGHGALADLDGENPLGFLTAMGVADSIPEAAYRFCRHEPGADVILTGTGSPAHLEENVRSILGPRLPDAVTERLDALFREVDSVSGN